VNGVGSGSCPPPVLDVSAAQFLGSVSKMLFQFSVPSFCLQFLPFLCLSHIPCCLLTLHFLGQHATVTSVGFEMDHAITAIIRSH
jgi:hypothetical protein